MCVLCIYHLNALSVVSLSSLVGVLVSQTSTIQQIQHVSATPHVQDVTASHFQCLQAMVS